jgi:hypothetical protein
MRLCEIERTNASAENCKQEMIVLLSQVDFDQKLGDQKWNNNNTAKPKMQNENMEAFGQLQEYFKPLQHELSELLVKHVQHGDMKFIGNMTPFIHEI